MPLGAAWFLLAIVIILRHAATLRRATQYYTHYGTLSSSFRVQLVRFRSVGSCESLDIAVGMIDLPESGDVRAVLPIMKTCEVVELIEAPPGLIGLDCRYPMALTAERRGR